MSAPESSASRVYPIARPPEGDSDPRFSFLLVIEVAQVLEKHGYPPIATGLDLAELQQALFGFIYGRSGASS